MAAEVAFDVLEQILIRVDHVKDIIRCKSVCKSWQSLISSRRFVTAHLKHACKNDGGHRRIIADYMSSNYEGSFWCNFIHIVGSCNGLVCISPRDLEFVVTNPSTREIKKLQTHPYQPPDRESLAMIRQAVCFLGFGYDTSTDDYKVIVGFESDQTEKRTLVYVLALKSNVWKVIGEVKYKSIMNKSGSLCGGALHWFLRDDEEKRVIMSVDLSTEECKEIPQPVELEYDSDNVYDHRLGVIEECLCIYPHFSPFVLSSKIWIMKNNNWELYNNNNNNDNDNESKHDVAHFLTTHGVVDSQNRTSYVYGIHDDARFVDRAGDHIRACMFVKSLVSPHPQKEDNDANGCNIRKRKRKRSCKHKKALVLYP